MKKLKKQMTALLLLFAVLFTLPTIEVQAATKTVTKVKTIGQIKGDYYSFYYFSEDVASVCVRDGDWGEAKYGFINFKGKEIVKCKYDDVWVLQEGLALVAKKTGIDKNGSAIYKYGYIDKKAKEVIKCQYDDAKHFSDGLAAVCKNDKWGFIDKTGQEVISCQYDCVNDFGENIAAVEKNGELSFIDKTGKDVICCKEKYASAGIFRDGLVVVTTPDEKYGLIDKNGVEIIKCQYDYAAYLGEGIVEIVSAYGSDEYGNSKSGLIDTTGKEITKCEYDYIDSMGDGLFKVAKDCGYGIVDKTGKIICKLGQYDIDDYFYGGMALVINKNGKMGFIDKTGKEVIKCQYEYVERFSSEGVAYVCKGKTNGFINKNGKLVIKGKYDVYSSFSNGVAAVKKIISGD